MTGRRRLTLTEHLLNLLAHCIEANAHGLKGLCSNAFTLVDEAEQNVLGADVAVV